MMRSASIGLFLLISTSLAGLVAPRVATAGDVSIYAGVGGASYSVPTVTIREARFKHVIRQQYDFSCGSAAVATLLTFHYGRKIGEKEVFQKMWAVGDQKKIRRQGFSLLDMKRFLKNNGYRADGFRVSLDVVERVGVPAIVLINLRGYRHFVVVKGIGEGRILVGDPAAGTKVYKREDLEKVMDSEVIFLIRNKGKIARANFNKEEEWAVHPGGPGREALDRATLDTFTTLPGGPNEF